MPVVVRCSCGQSLQIRDDLIGKRLACPACGAVVTASAPAGITAEPPPPPPPALPPPLPPTADATVLALGEVLGVWDQGNLISGENITVLTEHALCTGWVPAPQLKEAKRQLAAGAPVRQILGQSLRVIPLAALQAVQLSNKAATLALGFFDGQRRAQHTIQYCAPIQRWVFDALRQRLGPGWREQSEPATAWSAASLPLSVIGFLIFFDLLGFLAARQEEGGFQHTSTRGKIGGGIVGLIGSIGCLAIAVVLLLAGVAWIIYAVINRPPAVVTLTRASEPLAAS
jgi:hypothetical protein